MKIRKFYGKNRIKKPTTKVSRLQALDSSYFGGKRYFEYDKIEHYWLFQSVHKYSKKVTNSKRTIAWKFKVLSDECIKLPDRSDDTFSLRMIFSMY